MEQTTPARNNGPEADTDDMLTLAVTTSSCNELGPGSELHGGQNDIIPETPRQLPDDLSENRTQTSPLASQSANHNHEHHLQLVSSNHT